MPEPAWLVERGALDLLCYGQEAVGFTVDAKPTVTHRPTIQANQVTASGIVASRAVARP